MPPVPDHRPPQVPSSRPGPGGTPAAERQGADHGRLVLALLDRVAEDARNAASRRAGMAPRAAAAAVRQTAEQLLLDLLQERGETLLLRERERILAAALDEVLGLGPLEPLLRDPTVSEIMVNGPDAVYVERDGLIEETEVRFRDDAHVMHVIEKIVSPLGRRVDESSPMVDARLPDGSRVNAVIPPVALAGPTITIRKFPARALEAADLVRLGTLTAPLASFLRACVAGRVNTVVSGGTGTGKTTLLNVLSGFIPPRERIVTIEDAAELRLQQGHVVPMEARPANAEGRGRVAIRDLVINSLRMRPDRIVVGEVRGGEALDMLQAMNTGHEGSMTTAHANSPRDLLARLETMVLMAGTDLPARAARQQIAAGLDLIVHLERLPDGSRRVVTVTEVVGMEGDTVALQDLFVWSADGLDADGRLLGRCRATGIVPRLADALARRGIRLDGSIFRAA